MSRAKETWEHLAVTDAYYAVATFDKFRRANLDTAAKEDFFQTGSDHVDQIWNEIESGFGMCLQPHRALDYGCGVGRILIPLAERCEAVVGVDISPTMLDETRENCAERNITNIELQTAADFYATENETYDFVHSYIVLQHIEPKIGNHVIRKMIEHLQSGGVGMLHVTYFDPSPPARKLRFRIYRDMPIVHKALNAIRGKKEPLMPMYEYDLRLIFKMLHENGCGSTFVRFSDHGWLGALLFFRKEEKIIYQEENKMESTGMTTEMEALKSKLRATWIAGDFGEIAKSIETGAEEFVARLNLKPGMRVLDVACGTGNLAIPAAHAGANVTGIDIAPNLIEQAQARAANERLEARFDVGDAEALPYDDASFDVVMTMFGAMFAPRPDVTAAELKRVCKPGGVIAMANWTPEDFTGQTFKTYAKHVPLPEMPSPLLWGTEEAVQERLANGISDLQMTRRKIMFTFPFGPAEVVEHFRKYFGPTQKAFESLDADGQNALRSDLEELWKANNQATDGTTQVESEYLEIRAVKA